MNKSLNNLFGGNAPISAKKALEQVYYRQTSQSSFVYGNFKGMIERNASDRIYIGVWDADFH